MRPVNGVVMLAGSALSRPMPASLPSTRRQEFAAQAARFGA
jgi:hypothetical protein